MKQNNIYKYLLKKQMEKEKKDNMQIKMEIENNKKEENIPKNKQDDISADSTNKKGNTAEMKGNLFINEKNKKKFR